MTSAAVDQVRLPQLLRWHATGHRWAMVSLACHPAAALADEAGIPALWCSTGAVADLLGHPTPAQVSLAQMVASARAVARGARYAMVVASLPFGSYRATPAQALGAAEALVGKAGAHAVAMEGGRELAGTVAAVTQAGIPVFAHVGHTAQRRHFWGDGQWRWGGRDADTLVQDVVDLGQAGAVAVIVESVPQDVAQRVTEVGQIPTIGWGCGPWCDAEVTPFEEIIGLAGGQGQAPPGEAAPGLRAEALTLAARHAAQARQRTAPRHER